MDYEYELPRRKKPSLTALLIFIITILLLGGYYYFQSEKIKNSEIPATQAGAAGTVLEGTVDENWNDTPDSQAEELGTIEQELNELDVSVQ